MIAFWFDKNFSRICFQDLNDNKKTKQPTTPPPKKKEKEMFHLRLKMNSESFLDFGPISLKSLRLPVADLGSIVFIPNLQEICSTSIFQILLCELNQGVSCVTCYYFC